VCTQRVISGRLSRTSPPTRCPVSSTVQIRVSAFERRALSHSALPSRQSYYKQRYGAGLCVQIQSCAKRRVTLAPRPDQQNECLQAQRFNCKIVVSTRVWTTPHDEWAQRHTKPAPQCPIRDRRTALIICTQSEARELCRVEIIKTERTTRPVAEPVIWAHHEGCSWAPHSWNFVNYRTSDVGSFLG